MATAHVRFDREKLRAAVLYVVSTCEPDHLGAVKLHKVLYYTDMLSFLNTGTPVTGAAYRKRPFGPTCDALLPVLEELSRDQLIRIEQVEYYGFLKKQFSIVGHVETNRISEDEKTLLNEAIDFVCNNNSARTISEFSHDMVWEMVEFGDIIPYHNAIHLIPSVPSQAAMDWAEAEVGRVADTRSKSTSEVTVASSRGSAIRARMAELSRQ